MGLPGGVAPPDPTCEARGAPAGAVSAGTGTGLGGARCQRWQHQQGRSPPGGTLTRKRRAPLQLLSSFSQG